MWLGRIYRPSDGGLYMHSVYSIVLCVTSSLSTAFFLHRRMPLTRRRVPPPKSYTIKTATHDSPSQFKNMSNSFPCAQSIFYVSDACQTICLECDTQINYAAYVHNSLLFKYSTCAVQRPMSPMSFRPSQLVVNHAI